MQCWFWNIDSEAQEFFASELDKGILRQGWGYDAKLDMRKLEEKTKQNKPFDNQEQCAWNRCNSMLCRIKKGDYIVVKNIPSSDRFTIVEVTGDYDYSIPIPHPGDYGHILPVKIITSYHKYASMVPSPLINALNREQNPIRITYRHDLAVKTLAASPDTSDKDKPEPFKDMVANLRTMLLPHLKELLREKLNPRNTEHLILTIMRSDGMDAHRNAGPWEEGADILANVPLRYGLAEDIAVQVKMHWGNDNNTTGIDQIERAFEAHPVHAGLLVTTADELGDDLRKKVDEVKKKYNITVLYGEELYSRILEFIADPNLDLPSNAEE